MEEAEALRELRTVIDEVMGARGGGHGYRRTPEP